MENMTEAVTRLHESRPHAPVAQLGKSARPLTRRSPVQIWPGAQFSIGARGADNTAHPQPRRTRESQSGSRLVA